MGVVGDDVDFVVEVEVWEVLVVDVFGGGDVWGGFVLGGVWVLGFYFCEEGWWGVEEVGGGWCVGEGGWWFGVGDVLGEVGLFWGEVVSFCCWGVYFEYFL